MKYIRITKVKTMNCQFFIFCFSSIFILLCLHAGQLTNTLKERKGKAEKGKNWAFQYPTVKTRVKGIQTEVGWGICHASCERDIGPT